MAGAARIFAQSLAFHHRALLDLLAVRRAAESRLVGTLVGTLAEADLAALEELADRMRWRAGRGEVFAAEDAEFHRRLLACTGNLVALALADLYLNVVREMYQRGLPRPEGEGAAGGGGGARGHRGRPCRGETARSGAGDGRPPRSVREADQGRGWSGKPALGSASAGAVRDAVQAALLWPGPR